MEENNFSDAVLLNSFAISGKRCRVYLHRGVLIWESERSPYTRCSLALADVLAVEPVHRRRGSRTCCSAPGENDKLNCVATHHLALLIHFAEETEKHRWRVRHVKFKHSDPRQVASWLKTLQNLLRGLKVRPKRLLIFVNPFGGKRRGVEIYHKKVAPLLAVAGVKSSVVTTEAPNHARDLILAAPLDSFDGVLTVGGDGTFAEVLTALLLRSARDKACDLAAGEPPCTPNIRIGVIPAGSTDAVAFCLHGTNDVETALLHVLLGGDRGMDVCSVRQQNKQGIGNLLCFTASLLSYGYLGDIIKDSENFRWMGPRRYDYSGFKKFIANRGYEGELRLRVCKNLNTVCMAGEPNQGPKCTMDCTACYQSCELSQHDAIETDWLVVKGKFFMVNGANLSCACPRSPNGIAPFCHVGNGCVDVVLIRHTSRLNNLRLLLRLGSSTRSLFDLPFVEVHRAHAFSFNADLPESVWNCDGEILSSPNVDVRVHQHLVRVFARSKVYTAGLQ